MNIQIANENHIKDIIFIFKQASEYIASYGSDQWQGKSCPNEDNVQKDIQEKSGYVVLDEQSNVIAYMSLSFSGDENYNIIKNGRWESDYDYGVIHRIAVSDTVRNKGISKLMFDFAEKECIKNNIRSIRLDTHNLNEPVKSIMKERKYKKCGIIFLKDKQERIAYEKILIPFVIGDIIRLKKNHPCGEDVFKILRMGMDFRLECLKCKSQIWLSRADLTRRLKKRLTKEEISNLKY